MKRYLILFYILIYSCLVLGQKTFSVDTTSLKSAQLISSTNSYVHFNSSATQNIRQFNDSTFVSNYPSFTTYLLSFYSNNSFTADSIIQHNYSFYINNNLIGQCNSVTMNSSNINRIGSYMVELHPSDTLRIGVSHYHLFGSTLADTLKTFR